MASTSREQCSYSLIGDEKIENVENGDFASNYGEFVWFRFMVTKPWTNKGKVVGRHTTL